MKNKQRPPLPLKQLRAEFILSLITGCFTLLCGIFVLVVSEYFPDFGTKIGFLTVNNESTGFPPIDIFILPFTILIGPLINVFFGLLPVIFGGIIIIYLIFAVIMRKLSDDDLEYQRSITNCSNISLCIAILYFIMFSGLTELGIYPKICTIINLIPAAAIIILIIKRPRPKETTIKLNKEYIMKISPFFRSVVDADIAPIVICDTDNMIVYLNPAAAKRYASMGGMQLIGRSILECHNEKSNERIRSIVEWFEDDPDNNRVFLAHYDEENKDTYMTALRDERGELIGYYEKHEYRTPESEL